ncbi:MAG: hydrogenase expression/formation protein [Pseudomonadota bacterium]|nr:hydrogenase expression/formation protein [Pseudomonadota bacterium]
MSASGSRLPFPIPVVAIGPGSQPEAEEADFLPMPSGMDTYAMPVAHLEADPAIVGATCAILGRLQTAMLATPPGAAEHPQVDLHGVPRPVVELLDQSLGHGEVSVMIDAPGACRIQESVFTGVWRERHLAGDGSVAADRIIAAAIPPVVVAAAEAAASQDIEVPAPGPGIMNAPPVITELIDRSRRFSAAQPAHVINLTLLPMSPEDLGYLARVLDVGPVTILSRGYGNCRITATRLRHVWWVHYFNSMNQLILNTLEVATVPEVACAAAEDYRDSCERLGEWLATMRDELD